MRIRAEPIREGRRMTTAWTSASGGTEGPPPRPARTGIAITPPMTTDDLLGRVTVLYLRHRLIGNGDQAAEERRPTVTFMGATPPEAMGDDAGTARFIIDCLNGRQTSAIARAILADSDLSAQVDIKLPEQLVGGFLLPAHVLTDKRATYLRNAPRPKPALLLAHTGDDDEQALLELTPTGTPDL